MNTPSIAPSTCTAFWFKSSGLKSEFKVELKDIRFTLNMKDEVKKIGQAEMKKAEKKVKKRVDEMDNPYW